jgi:hypothetical protein
VKKREKKKTHILENVSAINSNKREKKKKSTHEKSSQQKLTFRSISNINSSCQKKR